MKTPIIVSAAPALTWKTDRDRRKADYRRKHNPASYPNERADRDEAAEVRAWYATAKAVGVKPREMALIRKAAKAAGVRV